MDVQLSVKLMCVPQYIYKIGGSHILTNQMGPCGYMGLAHGLNTKSILILGMTLSFSNCQADNKPKIINSRFLFQLMIPIVATYRARTRDAERRRTREEIK